MAVSFSNIPSNIRVPLFYAELDNSMAGTYQQTYRALLVGHSLTGTDANLPKLVTSEGAMVALAGEGSMLTTMFRAYRKNDTFTEVWALPIAEDTAGVAATGTITVTGSALENGVLSLYIAGKLVSINVATDDTASAIAAEIVTVVNANAALPVTATAKDAIKQLQTTINSETAATGSQNTARAQQEAQLTSQIEVLSDRLSITEQAKALAGMEFTNSNDAQAMLEDFIAQVETQLLLENVNTTDAVFSGLQNLKAAVVKDIQTAIKKLPEVTGLTLSQNTPAAVLAYDLYQDLDRAAEIIDRNKVRNPGFVPRGVDLEVLAS